MASLALVWSLCLNMLPVAFGGLIARSAFLARSPMNDGCVAPILVVSVRYMTSGQSLVSRSGMSVHWSWYVAPTRSPVSVRV